MRSTNWSSAKMFPLLDKREVTGQTRVSFCQQHNLSKASYYYWHARWKRSKIEPGFVPVQVSQDSPPIVMELRKDLKIHLQAAQLPEVLSLLGYAG